MLKNIVPVFIVVVGILLSWQFVESRLDISRLDNGQTGLAAFIPYPSTIFETFISKGDIILSETSVTLEKAFLGFAVGTIFAVLVSVVFIYFPFIRTLYMPVAFAINSFPLVGFTPAIILIFGQGSWVSIVFVSALISYFPTLISLDAAFREIDKELLELMNMLGASKRQILFKLRIPLSAPYLLLSMKLSIPASIIGATMGEWLGSRNGIGQIITISLYQLEPGLLYASLFTITLSGVFCIALLEVIQYYVFPWRRGKL